MIPGEIIADSGDLALNGGRRTTTLVVENSGDRPIQVGSHYHFFETNDALKFDRKKAYGCRLNIAAGDPRPHAHPGDLWGLGAVAALTAIAAWLGRRGK